MEFRKVQALRGPNIWAKSPVLEAWIDLGDLKDSPSNSMPGFNDRIMAWLPGMIEHECSLGHRGGFFERLRRGTYLAHILEHVTLELQNLAGSPSGYGRARETTTEGVFRVAFKYEEEAIARAALDLGRKLCLAAVHDSPFDAAREVEQLRLLADDARMGPTTKAMVDAARARGIPVRRLNDASLVLLGHGAKQHRIHRSATDRTGAVAEAISDDKHLTKEYLRSAGVPVARGRLATSRADAWVAAQEIGSRVVVKPKDCNYGNGVVIGISRRDQIEAAYDNAISQGSGVIVEQLAQGAEHRLLVVDGKFRAATRGNPACVTGDGRQTIAELVESQLNSDPRRGAGSEFPLAKVEFDPTVLLTLENEGFTPESIPAAGLEVTIQRNGNLSIDETELVHPSVRAHVEMAARVLELDVAGIDIIARDIARPLEEQGGVVIEVNAGPGLQMHTAPEVGTPRPVAEAIVATLFPEPEVGRIPLVAVLGDGPTAEVSRRITQTLARRGLRVGRADVEGIAIAQNQTEAGDCRTADAQQRVLLNPTVEAAVFEVSLDRICDEGLGFDRCQVAVLLGVGQGIRLDVAEWDTPDKLALVHRTVSDVVLEGGFVVLTAGEPLAQHIAEKTDGQLILLATDQRDPSLEVHRAAGGRAVLARDSQIVLCQGDMEVGSIAVSGPIRPAQLAAVAGAWGAGCEADDLAVAAR